MWIKIIKILMKVLVLFLFSIYLLFGLYGHTINWALKNFQIMSSNESFYMRHWRPKNSIFLQIHKQVSLGYVFFESIAIVLAHIFLCTIYMVLHAFRICFRNRVLFYLNFCYYNIQRDRRYYWRKKVKRWWGGGYDV